jgi:hypothetical protein
VRIVNKAKKSEAQARILNKSSTRPPFKTNHAFAMTHDGQEDRRCQVGFVDTDFGSNFRGAEDSHHSRE